MSLDLISFESITGILELAPKQRRADCHVGHVSAFSSLPLSESYWDPSAIAVCIHNFRICARESRLRSRHKTLTLLIRLPKPDLGNFYSLSLSVTSFDMGVSVEFAFFSSASSVPTSLIMYETFPCTGSPQLLIEGAVSSSDFKSHENEESKLLTYQKRKITYTQLILEC